MSTDYTRTWPPALDPDDAADIASYWQHRPWVNEVARQRGHTLRFHDETPQRTEVRTAQPERTYTAYDLDAERAHIAQLSTIAPGPPLWLHRRAERPLWKRLLYVLTWKYRRVF